MLQKVESLIERRGFLIGLLITFSLLWPFFYAPYFTHHDNVQVIRLFELDKCVKDGQIPCRWVPDLGGEYGYPIFNYYAPLPYYAGEIFYLLSGSLINSVKFMFSISFVAAYIFMYLLGKKLWGVWGGSLSGILYSLAPYHAVLLYVRGAMGEIWGLAALPAFFWAILRLREKTNFLNLALAASFLTILITSHNISTMIFLPVAVLFSLMLLFNRNKTLEDRGQKNRFIKLFIVSLILGFLVSAFYWLPMLWEKNLVHIETTTYGYFGYTEHFKGVKKLFLERSWGWGSSIREVPGGERDGMSFQIGWVHLLSWLLTIFLVSQKFLKQDIQVHLGYLAFFSVVTIGSIFMIHPWSKFIWDLIPQLAYIQFPWRFLGSVIFFMSLLGGGWTVYSLSPLRTYLWIVFVVLALAFNFSYFRPEKFIYTTDQELLTGENWDSQIKRSIFDFLPIYANAPPADLASNQYQILTGDAQITNVTKGSNWIKFRADVKGHSIVRLSQYYFPDWKVFANGQELTIDYKNHLGLITFILGKGIYQVDARLYDTPIRSVANLITVLGFIILVIIFSFHSVRFKNFLRYCLKELNQ